MEDKKIKKCSLCDIVGHNIRTCLTEPTVHNISRDSYLHWFIYYNV